MTRNLIRILPLTLVVALGTLSAMPAQAQDAAVSAAKAAGQVGEQADGYLGIKGSIADAARSAVDAINIKRRAAYTDLAAKRGVTVADMAMITGCQTLSMRVTQGQIYRIGAGDWQVKGGGPIALPDYCAKSAS
jgi:uncharacterized protein YdbL (DUF1318 family)